MSASSDRSAASSVPASRNHRDVIASSLFRRHRVPHPPVASPRRAAVAARFRRGRRRINNRAPARLRSFAHAPILLTVDARLDVPHRREPPFPEATFTTLRREASLGVLSVYSILTVYPYTLRAGRPRASLRVSDRCAGICANVSVARVNHTYITRRGLQIEILQRRPPHGDLFSREF